MRTLVISEMTLGKFLLCPEKLEDIWQDLHLNFFGFSGCCSSVML